MTGQLPTVALSIKQPWAWLVVNGHKDIENRCWRTNRRGPVLVHAGKDVDADAHQALLEGRHPAGTRDRVSEELRLAYTHALARGEVHKGGIVGGVSIAGCSDGHPSEWFVGEFGFLLRDAYPLPFMPLRGALSFFPVAYGVQP